MGKIIICPDCEEVFESHAELVEHLKLESDKGLEDQFLAYLE